LDNSQDSEGSSTPPKASSIHNKSWTHHVRYLTWICIWIRYSQIYIFFFVILLYINIYIYYFRYHCSYGPEDHRNNKELRQNHKRGCLAQYSIKILAKSADTVEIAYFHEEHTRIDGTPAHGMYDPDSSARPSALATRWSDSLKTYIDNRLKSGLNARQIYDEHHQVFAD